MESISRPHHRRKLSNANSFSSKNAYDDVFSGPPKCIGAQTFSPRVKDYTEIFGVSRASSIPILDVPAFREPNASADFRSSKIDYSKIFGGFNDVEDTCLSYEELFAKPKGGKRTSKKGRSPSETGPLFPGINNFNSPESNESFVSEVPCQSFDSMKQFNLSFHKTNQQSNDGTSGTTHIAELHAVPGYTCFINEGIPISKKEAIGAKASGISVVHCNMFPSDRKEDTKPSEKTVPQPTKKQTSKAVISNGHCNMFPSDRKEDTKPSEKTLPQPTKKQTSKAFISDGHCDMFPSDKKEDTKPSEKTVPQPTKKQTSKAFISDVHCNTYPSEEKLDVKPTENIVPQLTKRQASEASDQLKRGYSWDGSYVNGDFFRTNEINNSSQPSNVSPSSDARKGLPKRSHSSTFDAPKTDASEAAAGGSSPLCFDEELDVNSAAVMSAAALRKAIEKAQESIRLAKEIMERKTDGLQSSLDQSFKYSLKVKSKRDSKISCKGNEVQEKDSRETHGRVDSLFQVFDVTKRKDALKNGNVSPGTKRTENASTAGMVMGKVQINLSSVKECEGAVWLSELVNPGKHNTENIGYERVDGKDNLVRLDKHGYKFKQSERAMETHDVLDIHRNVNDACMSEGVEKKVCKLESARFMDIAEEIEKSRTAQENDEDWDQGKGLYEDETCLEEDPKAEIFVKKPDFQELNYYIKRPNESQKLEEEDTELAEAFKEAILEKRVEGLCEWEEDEDRFTKFNGEEKIRTRNIEVYHWLENEKKLKEVFGGIEGIEIQQKDANERGETKKSLDEASEVEVDDKRLMDTHYWEESEKRTEECHRGKNDGLVRASGYEAIESVQSKADNHKEIEIFQSKADTENESVGIPHEVIYGMSFDTAAACDSDENRVSEPRETYGDEMNVETCQKAVECEEGEIMVGITEEFSELEDEEEPVAVEVEPVAVEVACNKMFKGADFVQDVTEEIEVENKAENAYEEPEPVKVTCSEIFKGAGLVHGVTEENEINNKGDNAAEVHPMSDNVRDFCSSDMICEQQQSEQNGKESEPTSSIKNNMHMSNHEVQENGENFKKSEIIFNEEEKISDSETVCDTQWFENAQEIKVSQTLDVSGEKEKEVENYQEINTVDVDISTSQNLEKDQEITTGQHIGSDGEISTGQNMGSDEEIQTCQNVERGQDEKIVQHIQKNEKDLKKSSEMEKKETKGITLKEMEEKQRKVDETNEREREREKDRIAVERAIREARERAFAEARERAERAAVERATAEVRHRVMAEAREKLQKSSTGTKSVTDKSSVEAKLRAERAAVERATAEARERALEKALSQKTSSEAMPQADRYVTDNAFRENGLRHSFSSSDLERFDGTNHESAQRRKARLERHQRIMERAAKALAEKNMRDHHAQKEQAERNRLAEILDADIKRWASGKEGNLRALLSTLQYILGSDSGWQSISLTDLIATNAVKKAYRKATLYVHPDKLQQRGASIQQKYICEKVFDLLKAAWNRFNAEQR